MLTHDMLWNAIDRLAEANGFSASGLARRAGLDPTTFNKSKRVSQNGKLRWPTTESLAKVLSVTGTSLRDFLTYIEGDNGPNTAIHLPALGHDGKKSEIIRDISVPIVHLPGHVALSLQNEEFMPAIQPNDILVLSENEAADKGKRAVFFLANNQIDIGLIEDANDVQITITSYKAPASTRTYATSEILRSLRIITIYM